MTSELGTGHPIFLNLTFTKKAVVDRTDRSSRTTGGWSVPFIFCCRLDPMRDASEVMTLAGQVPGMAAFFSLVGSAIQNGRSVDGYRKLLSCGLSPERAWNLVDDWDRMIDTESRTGWTPEYVAMGFLIEDVANWWGLDWLELINS